MRIFKNTFYYIICVSIILFSCDNFPNNSTDINSVSNQVDNVKDSNLTIALTNSLPRFQIIQSTIAARGTYKLDSYSGDVFQMVVDKNNNETWQLLRKYGHENSDKNVMGHRNYELFISTIAMKFTYLLNVNTGSTWQLVQDSNSDEIYFSAIK